MPPTRAFGFDETHIRILSASFASTKLKPMISKRLCDIDFDMVFTVLRARSRFSSKFSMFRNSHPVEAGCSVFMHLTDFQAFLITLPLQKQAPLCSDIGVSAFSGEPRIDLERGRSVSSSVLPPDAANIETERFVGTKRSFSL